MKPRKPEVLHVIPLKPPVSIVPEEEGIDPDCYAVEDVDPEEREIHVVKEIDLPAAVVHTEDTRLVGTLKRDPEDIDGPLSRDDLKDIVEPAIGVYCETRGLETEANSITVKGMTATVGYLFLPEPEVKKLGLEHLTLDVNYRRVDA